MGEGRIIHIRNGRAQGCRSTLGTGATWCGKKLINEPVFTDNGIHTYSCYGSDIHTSLDPSYTNCTRCRDAFDAAYAEAFPEGAKPIATFRADNPEDLERARSVLSPEALNGFFGPGGGGMSAFMSALEQATPSPDARS